MVIDTNIQESGQTLVVKEEKGQNNLFCNRFSLSLPVQSKM
jgi:hypothetical protein